MEEKSCPPCHQQLLCDILCSEAHLVRHQHGILRITATLVWDAPLIEFILETRLSNHVNRPLVPFIKTIYKQHPNTED